MIKLTDNNNFNEEYMQLLINRVTHSTMSLEKDLGDPDNSDNAIRLRDNMKAFKHLLNNIDKQQYISEELIIEIANLINDSSPYISNSYRKTGDYIAGTNITISRTSEIREDLLELIRNYYNEWKNIDPFEREAKFHIGFIKIHPFEDGNGRTARLFLNYNLLIQGIAPVIITSDLEEYYYNYISNSDALGMANIFRIQSKREQEVYNLLLAGYTNGKTK